MQQFPYFLFAYEFHHKMRTMYYYNKHLVIFIYFYLAFGNNFPYNDKLKGGVIIITAITVFAEITISWFMVKIELMWKLLLKHLPIFLNKTV